MESNAYAWATFLPVGVSMMPTLGLA